MCITVKKCGECLPLVVVFYHQLHLLHGCDIYLYNCLFVCLFAINAKSTERIDDKRSEIMKNNLESVLRGLKSLILVLSGRYRDISVFPLRLTAIFTYLPSTSGSCLDA